MGQMDQWACPVRLPFVQASEATLGSHQFNNNEEVEMAVGECKSLISTEMEFLSLCPVVSNASVFSGIMLKNNDPSEK